MQKICQKFVKNVYASKTKLIKKENHSHLNNITTKIIAKEKAIEDIISNDTNNKGYVICSGEKITKKDRICIVFKLNYICGNSIFW